MKNCYMVLILMSFGAVAFAQNDKENKNSTRLSRTASDCINTLAIQTPPATEQANLEKKQCDGLSLLAVSASASLKTESESARSSDGRFICTRKGGYTVDFADCKESVNLYNGILLAEKAMQMQQAVRNDLSNKKISEKAAEQTAAGDGQGAALSSTIAVSENVGKLHNEQFMMYSAAVGALTTKLATWKKKGPEKASEKACSRIAGNQTATTGTDTGSSGATGNVATPANCKASVQAALASNKSEIFANDSTKTSMIIAATEMAAKAGIAKKNALDAQANADRLKNLPGAEEAEDADLMLEFCVVNPTHPDCVTKGNRTGGNYSAGSGSFGVGDGGSNAFDFSNGSSEFGEDGAAGSGENQNVASISSPFNDDVAKANGILNPAAAASVTPGGAAGGGGGGGAGGGLGGGSAALGNDLSGEEKAKGDPEIKSNKGGAYASNGGGAGFKGVAGSKSEDANPFASLFDQKAAGGGVEEDRDIASASDGPGSGLFQKISKRYGQVQADKRIEANNLE